MGFVTERCNGCRKTGGWHGIGAKRTDTAPVFHHVYVARKAATGAVKMAEFRLAEAKALKAAA
jgi:hypothetical protein